MQKKWVMANWKMNGSKEMLSHYIAKLNQYIEIKPGVEAVIFPPALYLPYVQEHAEKHRYAWGSQNVADEKTGAYTGEIAANMLYEYGVTYVLVGHSERRQLFSESPDLIAKKFHLVKDCGMIPVFCIGETLEQYQQGFTADVLLAQIQALSIDKRLDFERAIIAYEPVWAIGSGLTPTQEEITTTLETIKRIISALDDDALIPPILYGGSVSPTNIAMINQIKACQGVLVGGAALKVEQFLEIIECITCY